MGSLQVQPAPSLSHWLGGVRSRPATLTPEPETERDGAGDRGGFLGLLGASLSAMSQNPNLNVTPRPKCHLCSRGVPEFVALMLLLQPP